MVHVQVSRPPPRAMVWTMTRGPPRGVGAVTITLEHNAPLAKAPSRAVKWTTTNGPSRERRLHEPWSRPRVVVKTTSRGPFREVEAVARKKAGHLFMSKARPRPPSRAVVRTTSHGTSREG
uniref:Uncharacterized protein n=1 Tax=Solanum tuberosum TaxID=4113 RepID=M1D8T2_SOLTU